MPNRSHAVGIDVIEAIRPIKAHSTEKGLLDSKGQGSRSGIGRGSRSWANSIRSTSAGGMLDG